MKRIAFPFCLMLLVPVVGQADSIKMASKSANDFAGCTSFVYDPSEAFDGISCSISKVDTIDGDYRASLSESQPSAGDSVSVCAELVDHVYETHAGAKDLKVAEVTIWGIKTDSLETVEFLRFDILMDVPYYAGAINRLTGESIGWQVHFNLQSGFAQEIGTAKAIPGYVFVGWTGLAIDLGCARDPASSTVLVDLYRYFITLGTTTQCRVYANYTAVSDRGLTISSTEGGSVTTPGEGLFSYTEGSAVAIAATADEGYAFTEWSGTAVSAGKVADPYGTSTTVTMDADYTLVGNFAVDRHTLTVSSTAGGSVTTPGEGVFSYDLGSSVPIVATAESGYRFASWTGTAVDAGKVGNPSSSSTTVTVDADYTLQANFTAIPCTLTVSCTEGGSVTQPGTGTFEFTQGEQVTLEARAWEGYHFVEWSGSISSTANPTSVEMHSDHQVTAVFAPDPRVLTVSSTEGGSVAIPGEGVFSFGHGKSLRAVAVPDSGYRFAGWSGTLVADGSVEDPNAGRINAVILADSTLHASFEAVLTSIYVDDDAPNDPSPCDPNGSDPNEDGTWDHPFDTVQKGIDAAHDGQAVLACPGTYQECINFRGKGIMVSSLDRHAIGGISQTIIDGSGAGSVVTFDSGEGANSVLAGLTIVGGYAEFGGGIQCSGASPITANCVITGNLAHVGAGLWLHHSEATIVNCTVSDNTSTVEGGGLYSEGSAAVVSSIFWNNQPQQIVADSTEVLSVTYSDVQGSWTGNENIDADPCFAGPGDYHLRSPQGRWEPTQSVWVQDQDNSPCIDAGNPNADPQVERSPNGDRINCGAYGGTAEASLSVSKTSNQ